MSSHAEIRDLLPLYVLGALEGTPECDAVCAHLATGCPSCASALAEHARTASRIAAAEAPVAAPPELRARLETRLASTRREDAPARRGTIAPFPGRWLQAGLALAASIAVVSVLAAFKFQDDLRKERAQNYDTAKQLADLRLSVERRDAELAKDRGLMDALSSPDTRVFALAAQKDARGSGRIVWDKAKRRWILMVTDLAPIPADKAYELWFIAGNEKIPAGTFRPDAHGNAMHEVDLPKGLERVDVGAVTLEPAAGVSSPTGPVVIAGKVG